MRKLLIILVAIPFILMAGGGLMLWCYVSSEVSARKQAVENISRTPGKLIIQGGQSVGILEIEGCEYVVHWIDGDSGRFFHKDDCRNPVHKR